MVVVCRFWKFLGTALLIVDLYSESPPQTTHNVTLIGNSKVKEFSEEQSATYVRILMSLQLPGQRSTTNIVYVKL
jgi:hypothetical protein